MMKFFRTEEEYSPYFLVLSVIFITALITSNVIAVKIFNMWGKNLPAGIIVFPISYILGDVITEVYGYSKAKLVIFLGFLMNLLFVFFASIALVLPSASFWEGQSAFLQILGYSPRLLLASFSGYLIGSLSNALIMSEMRKLTNGKFLWTRTIASTIVGEGLDSLLFILISFFGVQGVGVLINMVLNQWMFKTAYEAGVTPVTYKLVDYLKKKEVENV